MGFVNALNTVSYGGHSDWTLLSSEGMATDWYSKYSNVHRGAVNWLWSSVEGDEDCAYCLDCDYGNWYIGYSFL